MSKRKIGLIGFGSIGQSIVSQWLQAPPEGCALVAVLMREHQIDQAQAFAGSGIDFTSTPEHFLSCQMDAVIEAAGQPAVEALAEDVLKLGRDLYVLSSGALADDVLRQRLTQAANVSRSQLIVPAGAIAGLDGLLALRRHGLTAVSYTSIKPPVAWRGTLAEQHFQLETITTPTVVFEGSAREAALAYPRNANIAATVALAGLGLTRTRVKLVADPSVSGNSGLIEAEGVDGVLKVSMQGVVSSQNPKTSAVTGMSVLSLLDNRMAAIALG